MSFASQWLLWIVLPVYAVWLCGFAALHLLNTRRFRQPAAALRFSSLKTLQRLRPSMTLRLRRVVAGLRIITIGLLAIALARPQTGRKETQISTEGIDIVLAVDTSGSMRALDLDGDKPITKRRNRLEVVKAVVQKFVQKRDTDQIGLVIFGGQAFTQCPLTLDHGIVSTFIERIQIGIAGDQTAIGSGLGTAVNRLKKSKAKSKVIILLTDGRNNAGQLSPKKAAEVAKAFGIKVYTIGAASHGKAPFLVDSVFGQQVVYGDEDVDDATLRDIADITGGAYFRAEDMSALQTIYDRIDQMEKTDIQMNQYMEYNERFRWFVVPALGLLLLEVVLMGTRFRKIP